MRSTSVLASVCLLTVAAACGTDEPSSNADSAAGSAGRPSQDDAPGAGGQDNGVGGDGAGESALYAVPTAIFDDTGTTSYVTIVDSLGDRAIELDSAAEFAGWSSLAAFGGALFVGGGESPVITRYEVSDTGKLSAGASLNFSNYGLASVGFSHNAFASRSTAHLRLEETSRILWNPTDLTIQGAVDAPEIARDRGGLTISAANFEGIAVRKDGVFWPYFWHDADWYEFSQDSQIGIYQEDGSLELLDVPCPALNIATQDEQGNLYFSGMVDTLAYQKLEQESTLERCVAKVNAGERTIAEGWPRQLEELTEGRPAGRFYYLRDGIGLLSVFHEELATVDAQDTFNSFFADHWALWLVNLEEWSAKRIEAWDYASSNLFFSRVDDRYFIHKVAADFSQTEVYELDVEGNVEPRFTVPGYSIQLIRIR